ncbi:MAG: glycerophosphodiester phosphodiesterase family protein [Clostridia bacterium]|nr:glycerophosphodiester phosphodiesterase family protein [Clostridia bacterium]
MKFRSLCAAAAALLACAALAACNSAPDAEPQDGDTTAPVETAAPVETTLKLTGGEHAYTVVRDEDFGENATAATVELHQYIDKTMALATDWSKPGTEPVFGEYEILVGTTDRPESIALAEGLGEHDYKIAVEGEKLVIVGGSDTAVANAVAYIVRNDVIVNGEIARDYSYYFDGADNRDEYIADPDRFLVNWVLEFDVPEWMTDWNEKLAAFADGDGRMLSSIHRADFKNYPEDSIEGIISAIQMGADSVELDLRLTRDGVVVLLHDETLNRTTDWAEKNGQNGLPTSNKLSDWSFDELRQLRLKMNDGTKTDYLIPTFEEALIVCNGRTTIRLDKPDVWDWDRDVYPLVQKTGAWQACILNYHFNLAQQKRIIKAIETEGGVTPLVYYKFSHSQNERENWRNLLDQLTKTGIAVMARWNGFSITEPEKYINEAKVQLAQIRDDIRIYIDAQALGGGAETVEQWNYLYENGVDFLLVDNGLDFQRYIAENFEPTPYEK